MIDFTPIARLSMEHHARRTENWTNGQSDTQLRQLKWLLFSAANTEFGRKHDFEAILRDRNPTQAFATAVQADGYEAFRNDVMRMVEGEENILWRGRCRNFAQSSGTSGAASKYIPVTPDSLKVNHYAGSLDVVSHYLAAYPHSRLFSGKAMILGGSFANKLHPHLKDVKIGDLSATLINEINPIANLFRVPSKETALLQDWNVKLERLAEEAVKANLTNISGVPSWFLRVLLRAVEISGARSASEIWPDMEVFFHGGISFEPYRKEYERLFDNGKMHYFETYNASEGFFATQNKAENDGLLLLIDNGTYYEFFPLGSEESVPIDDLQQGEVYELVISSCNGLWRYRIGDTVRVVSKNPVKIRVAGRTKSFINAFGEELMEDNAERAIAVASAATGARIANYTGAPVYAEGNRKGRHQWAIEWQVPPSSEKDFAECLDAELKRLNSDYEAKRQGNIFLDAPLLTTVPAGTFDRWLRTHGNGKLGGQRKIIRLSNNRQFIDQLLDEVTLSH